jgi:hypothetical protein
MLVRWAMLACLVGALGCSIGVPVLSSFRVQSIEIVGNEHVSQEDILAAAQVAIGDESMRCSEKSIRSRIVEHFPYIKEADVTCGMTSVRIAVTESRVRWAWVLGDGRVALLDREGYVADVRDAGAVDGALCHLFLPQGAQMPSEAGSYVDGTTKGMDVLWRLQSALEAVSLPAARVLDISNPYAVVLILEGGVQLHLNECSNPRIQLRAVERNLAAYLSAHPGILDENDLSINITDSLYFTVRPIPKTSAPDTEKTDESADFDEKSEKN